MADMNWFMIKPQPPISLKPKVNLASELHAVNDVPHLVREPLWVFTGGGVVVESLLHHPVPAGSQSRSTSDTISNSPHLNCFR